MKARLFAAALVLTAPTLSAQQPAPLPKGQMPVLGRPTESTDEVPVFSFDDYFPGTWTSSGTCRRARSAPAGPISGTTTYASSTATTYEASTTAEGPSGAFTVKERLVYDAAGKTITKQVTDSRGYTYTSKATVAGDLGGIYNILFTSDAFVAQGKQIQLKEALRTMSPFNYRVSTTVSVDGGPFTNYGTPWWRKQTQ
jgi:hypothetical protein